MGHNYVNGEKYRGKGYCKPKEVAELFVRVGWLGQRRVPHRALRLVPFFDIGPGPDIGR